MATYGGGGIIAETSLISTGDISGNFVGEIYRIPTTCLYAHIQIQFIEKLTGAGLPLGNFQLQLQSFGISNPVWTNLWDQTLSISFDTFMGSGTTRPIWFTVTPTILSQTGRTINIIDNASTKPNPLFVSYPDERLFLNANVTGSSYRFGIRQVLFKNSSGS